MYSKERTIMDIFLIYVILGSFAAAAGFGMCMRRYGYLRFPLLIVAPVVALFIVVVPLYLWDLVARALNPNWSNPYPIILQSLGAVFFIVPAVVLYGLIPSLVGYLLGILFPKVNWRSVQR